MESVIADLVAAGQTPKRSDIASLLAAIDVPGVSQDAKAQAVIDLFARLGGGMNPQGIHVADDLESYEEY